MMKRRLIHWLGLLGPLSLISYAAAVLLSPAAYPGYDWMSQAVSDLSAQDAPSRMLWQQLAGVYNIAGIVAVTMVGVYVENRLTKPLRTGIYLFVMMSWISALGYTIFPLTSSGSPGTLQDFIHIYIVTVMVVLLSILSLGMIMIGGFKDKQYKGLAMWAAAALTFMSAGAVGAGIVPEAYFGIPERFSVFAATAFTAVLGMYLFNGFGEMDD